jgi:hypothetical protein
MIFESSRDDILSIEPSREPLGRCKKCGKLAPAKEFRIHDSLGIMVCKNCFSSSDLLIKKEETKIEIKKPVERVVVPRTIVINKEEDVFREIDRPIREKRMVERKKEDQYRRLTCDKCSFKFRYNERKDWPRICPSCGREVRKFRKSLFY